MVAALLDPGCMRMAMYLRLRGRPAACARKNRPNWLLIDEMRDLALLDELGPMV